MSGSVEVEPSWRRSISADGRSPASPPIPTGDSPPRTPATTPGRAHQPHRDRAAAIKPMHTTMTPAIKVQLDTGRRAAIRFAVASIGVALCARSVVAQQAAAVTAADYARAERFLRDNVLPLVSGMGVQPMWLAND